MDIWGAFNRLLRLLEQWLASARRKKKQDELTEMQKNPAQWGADAFSDGVVRGVDGKPVHTDPGTAEMDRRAAHDRVEDVGDGSGHPP